ncbi:TolC family protein [Polymorphobacter fuscus]|uniref:Transporter n=1 Tax=Sandarakinorhabdus fusca TaxID=1439888 RepID=A0A7C9KK74_9SPHN|nr:TolC family protein [Polymorphobacter fuscus]KAB7643878.1 TolC family protein [Polymorphobacter fuscus]MQT18579.1 transporter [Polymorphobacter fuscus]NJC07054.1 outer membrane protein TolC [Polymorphobacter fuscus]
MIRIVAAALLLLSTAAIAAPDTGPLPIALVDAALDDAPVVTEAAARLQAAKAQARALGVGAHEFTVTGTYIRRTVDREGGYDEFDTTLSHGVRLPGKAALDRKAGALGVEVAQNLLEDARHQAALQLATLWYDWLLAEADARIDAAATLSFGAALAAVDRQVSLRDAAPLDADQARAARDNAHALEVASRGRATAARASLAAQFPSLPLPDGIPEIAAPALPAEGLAPWRDLVLARSHEIRAAEIEALRLGVVAERTRRDRFADPSIGVRAFSERSGAEQGIGVVASMPLGGSYRRALGDQAVAERTAAEAKLAATRRDIQATANMDLATANAGITAWQAAAAAASSNRSALERLRKGRKLGATDLATLLYAERQSLEANRAELTARAAAVRAILKLRIDAHLIWAKPE